MNEPTRTTAMGDNLRAITKIDEWKALGEAAEDVLRAYATRYKDEIKAGTAKVEGVEFVAMSKASFR